MSPGNRISPSITAITISVLMIISGTASISMIAGTASISMIDAPGPDMVVDAVCADDIPEDSGTPGPDHPEGTPPDIHTREDPHLDYSKIYSTATMSCIGIHNIDYNYYYYNNIQFVQYSEDDPIFVGSDWKEYYYYMYRFYGRAYLDFPTEGIHGGKVLNARMVLTSDEPTNYPEHLTSYLVRDYWDSDTILQEKYFEDLPEAYLKIKSPSLKSNGATGTEIIWNVTTIVDAWFNGTTNHGIMINTTENISRPYDTSVEYLGMNRFHGVGSNHVPYLEIWYLDNNPPLATIVSDPHPGVKEGTELTFSGEGTDPDGDGIGYYEWSSDRDGLLGIGPDMTSLSVSNLSVGVHKIKLRVMDDYDGLEKWSEYAWQNVRIFHNIPEVVKVSAYTLDDTEDRRDFSQGSEVHIELDVDGGTMPFTGWINISQWEQNIPLLTKEPLDRGTSYTWDTTNVDPDIYSVDVVIRDEREFSDTDGLFANGPDLLLTIRDDSPPVIEWAATSSSAVGEATTFDKGETVFISVKAANNETGLEARAIIFDSQGQKVDFTGTLGESEQPGVYSTKWQTGLLSRGDVYTIDIKLRDDAENEVSTQLTATIVDSMAPKIALVEAYHGSQKDTEFPLATALSIMVVEDTRETDLTGSIDIMHGDEFLVFDHPLKDIGEGRYLFQWNTEDLKSGWYSINVSLEDDDGNGDPDGLGLMDGDGNPLPDLRVHLTNPPARLVVRGTVPFTGSRDVPCETMIMVHFSQKIRRDTVNSDTIIIQKADGNKIEGEWIIDDSDQGCSFDPERPLEPDTSYTVTVTENVTNTQEVPATPYTFNFKTGPLRTSQSIEVSCDPGVHYVNSSASLVLKVFSGSGGDIEVLWSQNGRRVEGDNGTFTFTPNSTQAGRNIITATVPDSLEEKKFEWTVIVEGATEVDDGAELDDDNEGSEGEGEAEDDEGKLDAADGGGGVSWGIWPGLILLAAAIGINGFLFMRGGSTPDRSGGRKGGKRS